MNVVQEKDERVMGVIKPSGKRGWDPPEDYVGLDELDSWEVHDAIERLVATLADNFVVSGEKRSMTKILSDGSVVYFTAGRSE